MAGENLKFEVSPDLVMPIIKAKIETAIVEGFGQHSRIIEDMVSVYMNQKVSRDGKVSTYSSDNKFSMLEVLTQQVLESALKDAIKAFMEDKKELVAQKLADYFSTKKGTAEIIRALSEGIIDGFKNDWRSKIEFKLVRREDF